ncbi:MAG: ABC transporter ATP-binding protein [Lachnospiraceae bacterium]|nr:ABC transporter ATP-binding protein [Lachnospiraceae bacterium]MEE3461507.1 ABC transporter ATP-binding protein [Lachnospiraceae bacterium]
MIQASDLCKEFIKRERKGKKTEFFAVDHISFKASDGEIVGILGPNGAGKTTLLRMLGMMMKPTLGKVLITDSQGNEFVNEPDIKTDVRVKKHIGYLSENTKLYSRFSVREMLMIFAETYGYDRTRAEERVKKVSELLEMDSFIDNRIDKLSTGQKQRVSISRCLVHEPDIYIFDEPTLGLDVISSKVIIDFMKSEKTRGKTILYSTHYMEEAEFLCDRIVMIDHGHVIANGTPEDLKEMTDSRNMRETFFHIIGDAENTNDDILLSSETSDISDNDIKAGNDNGSGLKGGLKS